ncbi:hypothetical protein JHS3_09870 [Jeongeupia sp. HS-3]|uniref:DUF3291 domain-containing protein n=1 Tax=Jeongeupia sp. HS-3 TaxID=1009682 RepID=UPI0018A39000|nr:DUF3291 domain-containing protein [Jeongeupia sp. HS-3]BCL75251.1 hypothetical protein JHS3_09870 [Jeongeupia sp. HS-3]
MPTHELAQLNIAQLLAPLDSPQLAGFVARLDEINTLAERSPGFIWRLQTEDGDATDLRPLGDDILVNMSIWQDVEALHHYVYKTVHTELIKQRRDWFAKMAEAVVVLWWVEAGHRPDAAEAAERLAHLRAHGPSPYAFTFRNTFSAPESAGTAQQPCPANN